MRRSIPKFVALVLVLATLALPAAAVSACWKSADTGASGMNCPPGCPMMAQQSSMGDRVTAEPQGESCCKISSNSSAPTSVPQTPVSGSQAGIAPAKADVAMPVVDSPRRGAFVVEAPAPDTSPQAVLCTFLI